MNSLLTAEAAAKLLTISTKQLRDLAIAGEIAFVDVGLSSRPSRRYLLADIEEFIAKRRTTVTPALVAKGRRLASVARQDEVPDFQKILSDRRAEKKKATEDRLRKRREDALKINANRSKSGAGSLGK
ncbi:MULTISPECIES: helix-turn-helix domain-containing protein [Rhizobium]|uniref:Helix-turn-helix domain-containing protein n=1 Tax=Rhizobium favelukesii TaxID=348824 RepID=W6R7D9_9HYPH|nr:MULTISPECIES: helix-turn-helix domain-containing protein [Rhizobium]MCS0462924.1 helix-turn-helix domain-containing protein [Rhizobium favelukesii]UFS82012.1 helix-turn-helix domain-containing protein [Rhizobium sp. T136]CDM56310.1 hypothetical protein LPU83_0628 [Rhizobium favelukesii]